MEAAVSASISTPVGPVVATVAKICTPLGAISTVTSAKLRGSGWHMGISEEVCLAAWMPAKRAISRGLPLGFRGRAARTSGKSSTKAEAVAWRRVEALSLTSTMRALPSLSKWLSLVLDRLGIAAPAGTGTSLAQLTLPTRRRRLPELAGAPKSGPYDAQDAGGCKTG